MFQNQTTNNFNTLYQHICLYSGQDDVRLKRAKAFKILFKKTEFKDFLLVNKLQQWVCEGPEVIDKCNKVNMSESKNVRN